MKKSLIAGRELVFNEHQIVRSLYRPFIQNFTYYSWELNEDLYQLGSFFSKPETECKYISFVTGSRLEFCALAGSLLPNFAIYSLDPAQCVPLQTRDESGTSSNITDWALDRFRSHYGGAQNGDRPITKDAIFHYVYGVLHDPIYREKYALNLKREFPRIPFYVDFWVWPDWGTELMALHIGYESIEPWPLARIDVHDGKSHKAGLSPKPILKANKKAGNIQLDSETQLTGVPPEVWNYRLGNRSALEWILDQYKEKAPKDPTIREKFNTYRFADYKEKVIDLLQRVTRVSVETMKIVDDMRA